MIPSRLQNAICHAEERDAGSSCVLGAEAWALFLFQYIVTPFVVDLLLKHFRDLGVRNKFNPLPEVLAGKRVIVVDDSIGVRGADPGRLEFFA